MKLRKITETARQHIGTYAMVLVVYAVVEGLILTGNLSSHMQGLLVPACYYAICAVALNLCVGILGELSLGHAGFMGVGAFTSAVFSYTFQDTMPTAPRFIIAFLIGIAAAALIGFLVGIPVLRLNGDYLAIVTLAFGEILKNINNAVCLAVDKNGLHINLSSISDMNLDADSAKTIINGAQGITGTPHNATFTVAVVVLLISLFVVQNLIDSRDGRAIMAIRDSRIAADATGIPVTKYKMIAFTISAAIAGAAGVLFSHNISTLQSTSQYFGYNVSILILVYVVLGGIGNIRGSVIAAVILYMLPELLRGLANYRMLIYSIVLIVMMIINWNPKSRAFIDAHNPFKKRAKEVG